MIIPPINLNPVLLAARVAATLSHSHRIAYAQISPQLIITQYSSNFHALLEEPDAAVSNQPVSSLLQEFVGLEETLRELLRGRRPEFRLEMINRVGDDGLTNYLNFLVIPLEKERPEQGLLLLIEDVTENGRLQQAITQDRNELRLLQKRLTRANEEMRRLSQMKSLFLAMAAHDLRSPLSIIRGFAELAQTQLAQGKVTKLPEYLDMINDQANHLNHRISDLIDLDTIEKNELKLNKEKTDLIALLKETTDTLLAYFSNKAFSLELVLPETPCYLWLDRRKMSRVFYNLLVNAYKYTPEGGRASLRLSTEEKVTIQITDNGYGMNAEQLSRLFQPYYRAEKARGSHTEGSGLGLYIVKTFVEAHGGNIQVDSQPGYGSTFTISFPTSCID